MFAIILDVLQLIALTVIAFSMINIASSFAETSRQVPYIESIENKTKVLGSMAVDIKEIAKDVGAVSRNLEDIQRDVREVNITLCSEVSSSLAGTVKNIEGELGVIGSQLNDISKDVSDLPYSLAPDVSPP